MGIHQDDIAKVRDAADLVQIIGEHTEIKRTGRNWMARCPLHGERTPSMSVSPEKGVYHCFGCNRSGDVITFVQEIDNLDFVAAVEMLAGRFGVRLRYTSADEGSRRARKRSLLDAVAKAADFYHQRLLDGGDAREARSYLRSRGYDGELVRRYRLGWAPDAWDALARHLGLSEADLRDSGLGFVNRAKRQQDFFRARVMFPIQDERGDSVGFGGRILPGHEGPKYKNTTTDAAVYDKSKVLYGLHAHRDGIVKAGEAVVCEGYTDVIGCATAGVDRAVATCGTALTEDHVKLLNRFSANRLILAFDADEAGIAAAERVYGWEQAYELDVRVADLPAGVDPGDLARSDPAALRQAVADAVPFLEFRMERALGAADMSTPEGRARAASHAKAVVEEHPNPLVRDPYLVRIAERCRVDVARLREMPSERAPARQSVRRGPSDEHYPDWPADLSDLAGSADHGDPAETLPGVRPPRRRGSAEPRQAPQDEALRLAVHKPSEVDGLLFAGIFENRLHREAFEALEKARDLSEARDSAGPEAAELLARLGAWEVDIEPVDVLARVAELAADRVMGDIRRRAGSFDSAEDRRACAEAIVWLKSQVELLADSDTREVAAAELLPWLKSYIEQHGL